MRLPRVPVPVWIGPAGPEITICSEAGLVLKPSGIQPPDPLRVSFSVNYDGHSGLIEGIPCVEPARSRFFGFGKPRSLWGL